MLVGLLGSGRDVSLAGLANPTFEIGVYVILCSLYSELNQTGFDPGLGAESLIRPICNQHQAPRVVLRIKNKRKSLTHVHVWNVVT